MRGGGDGRFHCILFSMKIEQKAAENETNLPKRLVNSAKLNNKTSNVINMTCLPWWIIIFKGEFFNNFFISVIVRWPEFFHSCIYGTPLKEVNCETSTKEVHFYRQYFAQTK